MQLSSFAASLIFIFKILNSLKLFVPMLFEESFIETIFTAKFDFDYFGYSK